MPVIRKPLSEIDQAFIDLSADEATPLPQGEFLPEPEAQPEPTPDTTAAAE